MSYAIWNPYTTYVINNIVNFEGVLYVSLVNSNTNHQPNVSPTYWTSNGATNGISSVSGGSGISTSGTTAIVVTADISAGNGINLSGSHPLAITNNISGGNGIAISGTNPLVLTNNISGGNGIAISGTNPLVLTNNISSGNGIAISGTNPLVLTNNISGGNGIAISGTNPLAITNNITAGAGISISGTSLLTISATGASARNSTTRNITNYTTISLGGGFANLQNIGSIALTSTLATCNVFTIYIRSITLISQNTSGSTPAYIYVTDGISNPYDQSLGACSQVNWSISSTITTSFGLTTWNFRKPSASSTLYINVEAPSAVALNTITSFAMYYDIVGQASTIV